MRPKNIKKSDWYKYNALFFIEHLLGYRLFQKYFGKRQQALYRQIDSYLKGTPEGQVFEVELLDKNISVEDFLKVCNDGPKVFRAAASDWEAVKKWNLEFFEQNYGDQEVIIMDNVGLTNNDYEKMSLRDYINGIRQGSLKYLKFSDLVNENVELKSDFNLHWLRKLKSLPFSWGEDMRFFFGGKGTLTPLHVGFSNFFFIQVMGQKKWIFYPPNQRMLLDARTERTTYLFSHADPYNINDPKFPLMKYATRFEVTLNPGDIIWVPSFTWHHVENPTTSIAIRYGRASMTMSLNASKMFTMLMFLMTKPTLFEHFFTTMVKKRESIFIRSQKELDKKDFIGKALSTIEKKAVKNE